MLQYIHCDQGQYFPLFCGLQHSHEFTGTYDTMSQFPSIQLHSHLSVTVLKSKHHEYYLEIHQYTHIQCAGQHVLPTALPL